MFKPKVSSEGSEQEIYFIFRVLQKIVQHILYIYFKWGGVGNKCNQFICLNNIYFLLNLQNCFAWYRILDWQLFFFLLNTFFMVSYWFMASKGCCYESTLRLILFLGDQHFYLTVFKILYCFSFAVLKDKSMCGFLFICQGRDSLEVSEAEYDIFGQF